MIRNVQLLRAVAAILVVICHSTGQWGNDYPVANQFAFAVGFTGVDLFFVISGFVIAAAAKRDLDERDRSLAITGFAFNRLARIFPIYWIVILVASFMSLYSTGSLTEGAPVSFLQLATLTGVSPALGVAWTLQYELFFYAIVAAVMLAGPRRFLPNLLGLMSFYSVFILISQYFWPQKNFFLNPIILNFVFGILVCLTISRFRGRFSVSFSVLGITGMIVGTYLIMKDPWSHYVLRPFALGLPSALLLYGAIGLERRWAAGDFAVLLGGASYSIYIWHGAFFHQIRILDIKFYPSPITGLVLVVLTVWLGVLSYRMIEVPIAAWISARRRSSALSRAH